MIPEINTLLKKAPLFVLFLGIGMNLSSCASSGGNLKQDTLKNSRNIIAQGHKSLYRDGAFPVPGTSIRLIPPGPDALSFAGELAGLRARESLVSAIKKTGESAQIITGGSRKSYELSVTIHEKTGSAASAIRDATRTAGRRIISGSSDTAGVIIKGSWKLSSRVMKEIKRYGLLADERFSGAGEEFDKRGSAAGMETVRKSAALARAISRDSFRMAGKAIHYSGKTFIEGYASIPRKVADRLGKISRSVKKNSLTRPITNENKRRRERSLKMRNIIADVPRNYLKEVNGSFRRVWTEIENHKTGGISLAALKSLRWLMKALLYDSLVKPVAEIFVSSLGYLGTNIVAFPVLLVLEEGKAATSIAASAGWSSVETVYDIVAPVPKATLAAALSVISAAGGNLAAGTVGAGGFSLGYTGTALSKVVSLTAKGGGKLVRAAFQYAGAPLAGAGTALGGSVAGAAAGAGEAIFGAVVYVGGETDAAITYGAGNITSGAILVAGTAASTAAGAALGAYHISKAVAVPAGYEVGAGLVLSYDTLSHILAHTVLAVSDFSYLMLSLEGPEWVMHPIGGTQEGSKAKEEQPYENETPDVLLRSARIDHQRRIGG